MRSFVVVFLAMWSGAPAYAGHEAYSCGCTITRDMQEISISGVIRVETFFGPPGFGENPRTDDRIAGFIVKLDRALCVANYNGARGEFSESERKLLRVPEIQIMSNVSGKPNSALFRMAGRHLVLRGRASFAEAAAHLRPITMLPVEIEATNRQKCQVSSGESHGMSR